MIAFESKLLGQVAHMEWQDQGRVGKAKT